MHIVSQSLIDILTRWSSIYDRQGGYFSFILQCYITSTLDRVCSEEKKHILDIIIKIHYFFQARGTTPELLGISMTTDGGCMSPYRDFDVRSERKMKPSVGRTASFMSTTTTGATRQPHFSGGGQGKLLCVRFPGVLIKNNLNCLFFSPSLQARLLNIPEQYHTIEVLAMSIIL